MTQHPPQMPFSPEAHAGMTTKSSHVSPAQTTGFTTHIHTEKSVRKQLENDTLALFNRVKALQKEEERASKVIAETKQHVQQLQQQRRRQLEKQAAKAAMLEATVKLQETSRMDIVRMKEEGKRNRFVKESQLYAEKVHLAQQTKEEREAIQRMVAEEKLLQRQSKLEMKESVRKQQLLATKKRMQLQTLKAAEVAGEYERKLAEELEVKAEKEKELQKLRAMEAQLIEDLKKRRAEQLQAYEQLQAAINLSKTGGSSNSVRNRPHSQGSLGSFQSSATGLQPEEARLASIFSTYDKDGEGSISIVDFGALMRDLQEPLDKFQEQQALLQLDPRQIGYITFGEFALWWRG